ncbi:MAG: Single-stranded DNA-binding protein [Parcubacteria group bacterium ADurb.Bin326]|nr:MAG: Single-stranded DNA-binding protein [Parcubacteria group bacterium ADurb.Bin326]
MNLNKAIIIGNLTQNPEVRKTPAGKSVASFTIATNSVWTNQSGERQEQAEFHSIVAWGKLADIVGQYLAKGRLCMVEGKIQTRNWTDQAGAKHWKTEIIAENIQLGPKPSGAPSNNSGYGNNSYQNSGFEAPSYGNDTYQAEPIAAGNDEEEIKIEDIPF